MTAACFAGWLLTCCGVLKWGFRETGLELINILPVCSDHGPDPVVIKRTPVDLRQLKRWSARLNLRGQIVAVNIEMSHVKADIFESEKKSESLRNTGAGREAN